jgi:hypothetical protein
MQPDEAIEPVVVREPDAVKVASPVLRGEGSRETSFLPSHSEPIQVLQAAARPAPAAMPAQQLLIAGATGTLGNEVLRRLVGAQRFALTQVLAREPMRDGLRGVEVLEVPGEEIAGWTQAAAGTAIIMFEPPRLFHDRERALWTPQPAQLVALAAWLRAGGVTTLAIVLPHAQGRLPEALKRGLASLDEQAVAVMGFERVIFIRSAQKPAPHSGAGFLQGVAHWMLSIAKFMVPSSEQPVRAAKVAELLDLALQLAPPGIHVAPPEMVWRASQGKLRETAGQWLGT